MSLRYTILLEPEDDGAGFAISAPSFPGLVSFGRTREEAVRMAHDAARGLLLSVLSDDDEIPIETAVPVLATIELDLDALRSELAATRADRRS
jgi:predicted RNase H-like HicB family nuclease